ncbi:hypothetical protein ACIQ8G_03730 [Streptomyces sp. NPDC094154]|uniref:hypothetical protein n=1 Tax=Streptomyces sp. NPDC094154 TaxID=3366059 RepID=UPI003813D9FD
MTDTAGARGTMDPELHALVLDAIAAAQASGNLTEEERVRARVAMQHGAVAVDRDRAGGLLVTVGSVFMFACHESDLPTIAAQWEAWYASS